MNIQIQNDVLYSLFISILRNFNKKYNDEFKG